MSKIKAWPHLALIAIGFALLGGIAAAFWFRSEPTSSAAVLPNAARVERVDGEVGLNRGGDPDVDQAGRDEQWIEVTPNTPVSVGDRLYTRDQSQASIAFTGRNFARLDPDSSLDVIGLSDDRTQLALRDGSAIFNIGELDPDDDFEVATPVGAFDLQQPGLYEIGLNDDGSAWVSVLSGLAEVVGLAGTGQISKGEMLTLVGQTAANIALSRISPDYAGGLLDDYYGYQYPQMYDGRYRDYNAYLNDPDYYDPYNRYTSYRYVNDSIPGIWELDQYGDWQDLSRYGQVWRPRVDTGWSPYQQGYWMLDEPYGLTWVSSEPWGYAPYHYGRWVNDNGQWYWVPESSNTQPVYSPALVAFVPFAQSNEIGWVPLAPGDPYVPTYYDANWSPHYLAPAQTVKHVVNLNVPGAITIVSADEFGRVMDSRKQEKHHGRKFDGTHPVLDPLSTALLRQAALATTNTRRRVDMPPGLAKRLDETQVFTSARTFAPGFKEAKSRVSKVEVVPERQKKQKLQFKDERQVVETKVPPIGEKRAQERINRSKKAQEIRHQERSQRVAEQQQSAPVPQAANEKHERKAQQTPQGERVSMGRGRVLEPRPRQEAAPSRPKQQEVRVSPGQMRQQQAPQPKAERKQEQQQRGNPQAPEQDPARGNKSKGKGKP